MLQVSVGGCPEKPKKADCEITNISLETSRREFKVVIITLLSPQSHTKTSRFNSPRSGLVQQPRADNSFRVISSLAFWLRLRHNVY